MTGHPKRWKVRRPPQHEEGKSYQDLRQQIQTGDLLLFRGNRLLSSAIERLSDSPYSHVAVLARWEDRIVAFQADLRGVEVLPASTMVCKYQGKVDWWALKRDARATTGFSDKVLLDTSLTLLGIKYGYLKLALLGLRILLGRALNPRDAHATPDTLFCSQFVSLCYRTASDNHLDVNLKANDASTSPSDFATSGFFEPRYQLFDGSGGDACRNLLDATPMSGPSQQAGARRLAVHRWDGTARRPPQSRA